MASEIKANKISPATGTAFTIGDSGDTFTVPSGATLAVASGATISNAGTASGFGGTNTPYFSVYMGTNQTITSSAWTKLQHNTVHVDSASGFDNTTNYRYTVPAGQGGKYFISCSASGITGSGNANQMYTSVYINGSKIAQNLGTYIYSGSLYGAGTTFTYVYTLSAGDYIEHYAWLNGSAPFIYAGSWFSAFKLVE